jgi:AraC-like DNA-binding protein
MSTPALINRYAHAMIHRAAASGYDYDTVRREASLRTQPGPGRQPVFSGEDLARISRHVKLLMRDEFCGFTRSPCKVGAFELMCELSLTSATLGEALQKAFRFYAVLSDDIRFTLSVRRHAVIEVELARPEMDRDNFLYEWWLLVWHGIPSWLIGERTHPLAIEFPHAPAVAPAEYTQAFAGPCEFRRGGARLIFDRHYLARPILRSMEELREFLAPRNLQLGEIPDLERTLKARVKLRMQQLFCDTQAFPSMEDIAAHHHVCSQTLRRRLEQEGSGYRELKEEIRREVVMKWLSNPAMPIGEVSHLGGFAEASSLARAVKSWTGLSPSEYRAGVVAAAPNR